MVRVPNPGIGSGVPTPPTPNPTGAGGKPTGVVFNQDAALRIARAVRAIERQVGPRLYDRRRNVSTQAQANSWAARITARTLNPDGFNATYSAQAIAAPVIRVGYDAGGSTNPTTVPLRPIRHTDAGGVEILDWQPAAVGDLCRITRDPILGTLVLETPTEELIPVDCDEAASATARAYLGV